MSESELRRILQLLNEALAVYQKYDGKLTATDVSVKSMLSATALQISRQLAQELSQTPK